MTFRACHVLRRLGIRSSLALLCSLAIFGSVIAKADELFEAYNFARFGIFIVAAVTTSHLQPLGKTADSPAAITSPRAGSVYKLSNQGADLEPGEPTEGGILTRSIWARITPVETGRIVLHTFGSDVDTVAVVYTGSPVNALTRIAGNNDFVVPGVSSTASLVQFNATAGVTYWIQIGSIANAQGDIILSVFQFGTDGGLSAFLYDVGGNPLFNARDYFCGATGQCPAAKFIVYNSTAQALSVVASSTIGSRFTPPPTFGLAPGAATVATFTPTTNSNFTTRTDIGQFIFSGRIGGSEVSRATHRGIAPVQGLSDAATLQAAVLPSSRAGGVNEPLTAFATIANTSSIPAVGCFIKPVTFDYSKVTFQETNPNTNLPVGTPNAPVDIPAGQHKTFLVAIGSEAALLGNVTSINSLLDFRCANGFAPANAANRFNLTALGTLDVADMISISATAGGNGIVDVPAAGGAFSAATVNIGPATTITARPVYVKPFADSASFTALICKTNSTTGTCLQPPSATVQFSAATNVAHTFAVFVQRPATDPGFSPGERRMFLQFEQTSPPNFFGQNPIQLPVGATSVATRAQ